VIVDYAFDHNVISVAVKNTGATPALDVKVEFDPPPKAPSDFRDIETAPMFTKGIPMMAPGREMRVRLGDGQSVFEEGRKGNIPMGHKVTATYSDLKGRRYDDPPLYLDLNSYTHTEIERRPLIDALKGIERAIERKRMWPAERGDRTLRSRLRPPARRDGG
jgi:hypothetical protein